MRWNYAFFFFFECINGEDQNAHKRTHTQQLQHTFITHNTVTQKKR